MAYPSGHFHGDDANPEVYMAGSEDYTMDEDATFDNVGYSFSDASLSVSNPSFSVSTPGFSTTSPAFSISTPSFPSTPASSKADQQAWMQSIVDIFELSEESEPEEIDDDGEPAVVDLEAQDARTERLRTILPALDRLWWANSDFMAGAAEKLADGSRDPRWRIPIGNSGILNSFLAIAATPGVPNALMIHVLRLIGNSCADRDENRERVVAQNYIPAIASLLKNRSLLPFVIPVLFNICIDYEPAQLRASEAFLSKSLMEVLLFPSFGEIKSFISYITKILDMMVSQPGEFDRAPENLPAVLTDTAFEPELKVDLEDFLGLAGCTIAYLQDVKLQQSLIKRGGVDLVLRCLFFSYTRFEDISSSSDPESSDEDAKALTAMRSNMNQVLSDISALPEFAATYPVTSPFTGNLRRWLSSQRIQLQVCACIILGNLARSDAACEEFCHKSQIHKPLIGILETANDSQILHAALGFLKNLALPSSNKVIIGDADIVNILPRLWQMETLPQIQYSAISLMRQLAINNLANVRRLCVHLSEDQDSPAYERSRLSILIAIFARTDAEPIKMEIARLITAICRAFTSPNVQQSESDEVYRRQKFFARHPDVGRPIAFMVKQTKWPVVRSEGWFVMALMARTPEGAICVSDLMHDIGVFQPLVETLTGKGLIDSSSSTINTTPSSQFSSPSTNTTSPPAAITGFSPPTSSSLSTDTTTRMQRIDRENALVLVTELLRQHGSEMASMRRSVFEDLLKGGGAMHLTYAQIREREDFFDGRAALGTGAGSANERPAGANREGQGVTTLQEWAEGSASHLMG